MNDPQRLFFCLQRSILSARKLRSLTTPFESLTDPRQQRTRLHNLLDIIALTIWAVISGADSWVADEKYGNAKRARLQRFLQLPNGIPSLDTIGRFFATLCLEQFRACPTRPNCKSISASPAVSNPVAVFPLPTC